MSHRKENIVQIASKLKDFGLGLRRKTVDIIPYNNDWPAAFLWLKQRIEDQPGKTQPDCIEHIGSTSIPGMAAKTILDILIVVKTTSELNTAISLLEELGFVYKGDAISNLQNKES